MLFEADAGRALGVASTSEVQFDEGFGILSYENDSDSHPSMTNHAFRWMGQNAHIRLKTHGSRPMKFLMVGWAHHVVWSARDGDTEFALGETRWDDGRFIGTFLAVAHLDADGQMDRYMVGRSPAITFPHVPA